MASLGRSRRPSRLDVGGCQRIKNRDHRPLPASGERRAAKYADATIAALYIDAPGFVPWWPRPNVKLFNILVHVLTETHRHAGHADILREQLDGSVGFATESISSALTYADFWETHRATVEQAAKKADPDQS